MPVRTVTGTIRTPTGDPWDAFTVTFRLTPSTATLEGSYPEDEITATSDATGAIAVELVTGVRYEVAFTTLIEEAGRALPGSRFSVVVPEGETPVALETLRAAGVIPPTPTVLDVVTATVQGELDARLAILDGGAP